jgi:hypothetical protein
MFGVQAAVLGVTCLVVIVMLLTAPFWMRALTAFWFALWKQFARTDAEVSTPGADKDIVEGEFREVDE